MIVNINDLRAFNRDIAGRFDAFHILCHMVDIINFWLHRVIRRPRDYIVALKKAAEEVARMDPGNDKLLLQHDIQIGFEGSVGGNSVSPRGLLSNLLNSLVEVEGIVTKCSGVKPKLMRSVHYSIGENGGKHFTREYRDATAMDIGLQSEGGSMGNTGTIMPTGSAIPSKDASGNPAEMELGLSVYKDCQTVMLQEMPERAKVGQLPRSIEVILECDLVDRVKPGDRVQCIGVFRPLASTQNGQSSGIFKTVILGTSVSVIGKEVGAVRPTADDVKNIR